MSTKSPVQPITAADVRAHFQADKAAFDALSEAAQATVVKGARGRIHPEAREGYNKGRTPARRYSERNPRTMVLTYKRTQPSGRKVAAAKVVPTAEVRKVARDLGLSNAKSRGPLSPKVLAAVAEHIGNA